MSAHAVEPGRDGPGGSPSIGLGVTVVGAMYLAWSVKFIERASFLSLDRTRHWGIFDDALISMRYAWNLAQGHGLVWNPGERVEGYSNLLTTLLMALFCTVFDRRTACLAVALTGVATVLAAAYVTCRLAARLAGPGRATCPPALALASALTFYPLSYWSLSGMETGLVTVLFLGALLATERWAETGRDRYSIATGLALGLLCVARPDGVLLAAIGGLGFAHVARRRDGSSWWRRVWPVAGVALIPPAIQLLVRLAYYRSLVPNTYVLKLGLLPLGERLRNGLGFVRPFWPAALTLLAALGFALRRRPSRLAWVATTSLLTLLAYQVAVGGDPWRYWRIVTPAVPLAMAVGAHGLWTAMVRGGASPAGRMVQRAVALTILACGLAVLNAPFLQEATFRQRPYQWEGNVRNVRVAEALGEILGPDASVGVYWAGSVPYYTELKAVDFLGKTDPVIARTAPDLSGAVAWSGMNSVPGHNKYDLHHSIVELRPTYVEGFRWGREDVSEWGRAHYDSVTHRDVPLWLRHGAPEVRWERIRP